MAYSIAIRLVENEIMPPSKLVIKSVSADQVTGRNTVKVNLQNPTPTIIDQVTYKGTVSKKGSNEVLHETSVSKYRVAPNTNYNLPINWENQPFEAGTYTVNILAKSEEPEEEWQLTQDFTITAKEAKELNEKAIDLEKNYMNWVIYGGITFAVLMLLMIILLLKLARQKKAKKHKRGKNRNRTNNKKDVRNSGKHSKLIRKETGKNERKKSSS